MSVVMAALIAYLAPFGCLGYYVTLRAVTALFGQEKS